MQSEEREAETPRTRSKAILIPVLIVSIAVLSVLDAVITGVTWPVWIIAVLSVSVIVLERRSIPRAIWFTSLCLLIVAAILLPLNIDPQHSLEKGLSIGAIFVSLVASVAILGKCAIRTQIVQLIGESLAEVSTKNRYVAYSGASQIASAMLSLAGTNVLFAIAAKKVHPNSLVTRSTFGAIARGFSAATFWSPMFGNMSIMLAIYPALSWGEVLPLGFVLAQLTLLMGVVLDRMRFKSVTTDAVSQGADDCPGIQRSGMYKLSMFLLVYIALLIGVSESAELSITAVIVLSAPFVSVMINSAISIHPSKLTDGVRVTLRDIHALHRMVPEMLIFLTSGVAGIIMAQAIPETWIQFASLLLSGHVWLSLLTLVFIIVLLSLLGVHPILSAVMIASSLSPAALGLNDITHFSAILMGWGLAATFTPFSVLNITGSHLSGVSLFSISVRENLVFTLTNLILITFLLSLLEYFISGAW